MKVDLENPTLFEPPPLPETDNGPKNEFLRLLVAQMQHQDPLEPQDGSEFVAQLAQFANIELGVETNTRLAALEQGQQSASRATLMGLVGKDVTANATQFAIADKGDIPDFQLDLKSAATNVEIIVYDENKAEVARIDAGALAAGKSTVEWNGLDKNGVRLPEGKYTLEVAASSSKTGVVESTISFKGLTTYIEFAEDGSTLLGLGGVLISPSSIQSVADAA